MKTIRRIYFYLLTFIGLQLIVWGLYTLLSGIWTTADVIGFQDILPTGLSLVLIGLPVFIIHFRVVQNDAALDEEENDSLVRAIFLFLTQMTALGAISISSVNLIDQLIRLIANLSGFKNSTLFDQIAIIILNLLVWYYLFHYLFPREEYFQNNTTYKVTRRVYRYIWLVAATVTTVIALQGQLSDIFSRIGEEWISNFAKQSTIKLSTVIIWTPIWAWTWNILQKTYTDIDERKANIRYILNLCIAIISMAPWLISGGIFLNNIFSRLFEKEVVFHRFFYSFNIELSVLIPFFFLWFYYQHQLKLSLIELEDENHQSLIHRIHAHILSIAGNILTVIGLWFAVSWLIDTLFDVTPEYGGIYDKLSAGLALLIIGIPLWILHWRKLQAETAFTGNTGIIARKATLRRFYLYFFVFGSVIGIMGTAGSFFYNLLFIILGRGEPELGHFIVSSLFYISIFVVWLIYHLKVMRIDNLIIKSSIKTENETLSILMIKAESDESLVEHLQKNINSKYQHAKIKVLEVPDVQNSTDLSDYQAILITLPTYIANLKYAEQAKEIKGNILLIPVQNDGVIPLADTSLNEITRNVMNAINQIKHGSEVKIQSKKSALHIVAYIIGGFIALNILWQLLMGILMVISD